MKPKQQPARAASPALARRPSAQSPPPARETGRQAGDSETGRWTGDSETGRRAGDSETGRRAGDSVEQSLYARPGQVNPTPSGVTCGGC